LHPGDKSFTGRCIRSFRGVIVVFVDGARIGGVQFLAVGGEFDAMVEL